MSQNDQGAPCCLVSPKFYNSIRINVYADIRVVVLWLSHQTGLHWLQLGVTRRVHYLSAFTLKMNLICLSNGYHICRQFSLKGSVMEILGITSQRSVALLHEYIL